MSIIYLLLALIAGILIGVLITRRFMIQEVKKAYDVARQEFESKKTELSDKIGDQLSDMRHGLVRTLEAYVGAVSVVRENLPISAEKLSELIAPAKLRLGRSDHHSNKDGQHDEISVEISTGAEGPAIQPIMSEAVAEPDDDTQVDIKSDR